MTSTFPLTGILGRELGFTRGSCPSYLNYKDKLTKLTYREEDRLVISPMNPIYSMEFCPLSTQPKILAVSDEIGGVTLIDTQTSFSSKVVAHHACHNCSLYTITWSVPRPNLFATGASDQTVCVWEANTFQKLATFTGHSKTVRRVRFHPAKPELIGSCSRDGNILLWDLRSRSGTALTNTIYCAHSRPNSNTSVSVGGNRKKSRQKNGNISNPVTDFVFVDDNTLISCGATDSQIKFWDIRKTYKCLQKVEPFRHFDYDVANCTGYSGMALEDTGNLYLSTAKDDIIRFQVYGDSTKPNAIYKRPSSDYSVNIGLSSDGRYLISGSVTPHAFIWDTWDTSTQLPFVHLEGTRTDTLSSPCALFAPNDPLKIVTAADDSSLIIWRLNDTNSGTTTYGSTSSCDIPLAPFLDIKMPKVQILPKQKLPTPVISSVVDSYLKDLPNFVLDGQLPHVVTDCTRKVSKTHTWLANFSMPKHPSAHPIKKTIKLKRKVIQPSSPGSATGDKCTPKRNSISGPPKKRQCLSASRTSTPRKLKGLRKSMAACSMENDTNDSECPSVLKYFSPVAPLSNTPLREV